MGSKDHKRHRDDSPSSSGSSSSDDDREHKRQRKVKEAKGKKDKKHKKHKDKDKEAKRLVKEAKKFLKQKLAAEAGGGGAGRTAAAAAATDLGKGTDDDIQPPAVINPITEDEYYNRSPEFSQWLLEARNTYFSDLTTEETHERFRDFVKAWNKGKLPGKYYAGMAGTTMRRTAHNWGIKALPPTVRGGDRLAGAVGLAAAMAEDTEKRYEAKGASRQAEAGERRKWRADQKELLDEMLPKATGREAMIEKKAARREAARARDDSPDHVSRSMDIMGDDDSFAAARDREAGRASWKSKQQLARQDVASQRLAAAQAEENDKMAAFRALVAKGPITIRKRDG